MAGIVHETFFMCTPNSVYIPTNSFENALCLITVDCLLVEPGIGYDLLGILAVEFAVVCFSFFTHFEQFVDVPAESISQGDLFIDDHVLGRKLFYLGI